MMWNNIASNFVTAIILGLLLIIGSVQWAQQRYVGTGPLDNPICLTVPQGSTMSNVVTDLQSFGALSHPRLFRLGADYSHKSNDLKAGSYLIAARASMQDILDTITGTGRSTCGSEIVIRTGVSGASVLLRELDLETSRYQEFDAFDLYTQTLPKAYATLLAQNNTRIRFIIVEGTTVWQVVRALNSLPFLQNLVDELPVEGSLAPGSYEIVQAQDRGDIIKQMQSRQEARVQEAWSQRAEDLPLESIEELLILASIIEKETGLTSEQGVVASVFMNRLQKGMKLQTDPAVIYGVTEGKGVLGRGLRQSELSRETPWNTYVIEGLPPTAIANPSVASLQAAAMPSQSDYLFFVANGEGGHAFAKTLQEHNRNVAQWRKIERERQSQ